MREALILRVHSLIPRSYANGPGCRAVIWTQGCGIGCPGCFNPEAQRSDGGEVVPVPLLAAWLRSVGGVEGVTLTGGEPLEQQEAVFELLREIRAMGTLSVVLFTGYPWNRIARTPLFPKLAALTDVVVAGPYRRDQPMGRGLRGSSNQTIHLMSRRYSWEDVDEVPELEVVLDNHGAVVSGVIDADLS